MPKTLSDDLKKMSDVIVQYRTKREQVLNSIRSNENSFDDDIILCRVVAELTEQIAQFEASSARHSTLSELGLFDTPVVDA